MITFISALAYSCPLILCSLGALFTEYAGCLALFLDGLVSFSAFLNFSVTVFTGSAAAGITVACLGPVLITLVFSAAVERWNANRFIAAIAMNLFFGALTSCLSQAFFGTQGVLAAEVYKFSAERARLSALVTTAAFIALALWFLGYCRHGLYVRVAGSDADDLKAKGVEPGHIRTLAWSAAALYGSLAGSFLAMRLSSFVPNISSGRGWMALAAVFLGRKKPLRIVTAVLIFCLADIFAANIQNYIQGIPSSFLISLPYLVSLLLILIK